MLFLCKFCLFPIFLFVLVIGKKTLSSRTFVRHSTAQPFVPFEAIWAIGLANEHILLISDSHMLYLVSDNHLGRYLPLYNATIVPMTTLFHDNDFTQLNATLNHAVILHRESHQSILYFDIRLNNRDGIGDVDWLKMGYLIDLDTKAGYRSSLPVADSSETWLSTVEENIIFVVQSEPDSESLSLAKCEVKWNSTDLQKAPDLRAVTNLTAFYTLCLLNPDLHDQAIFLTPHSCPHPVQWNISTGFVDDRNIFPSFLYLSPGISGTFIETDFDDFFWHHFVASTPPKADSPIGLLAFLICCVVIFLVTFGGIIYFLHEQNETESDEEVREKRVPSPSKSRSKEWMKFTGKKRQSEGDLEKLGSKMLPSAEENQKGSLKTDWTEASETRVKSKHVKGRAVNGSYSNKKKTTSNGKLKGSKSAKGGKGFKLPLRKSPSGKSKSKGKRMRHDSSSAQAVLSVKSKPRGKSSSKKASPRNKKK